MFLKKPAKNKKIKVLCKCIVEKYRGDSPYFLEGLISDLLENLSQSFAHKVCPAHKVRHLHTKSDICTLNRRKIQKRSSLCAKLVKAEPEQSGEDSEQIPQRVDFWSFDFFHLLPFKSDGWRYPQTLARGSRRLTVDAAPGVARAC